MVELHGAPKAFDDLRRRDPLIPRSGTPLSRLVEIKRTIHIADLAAEELYANSAVAKLAGGRTFIGVPMFKENDLVGAIAIYRQEVRPFTDKQIELVKNFAAQAVIAIENARLLNELRQRTTDLTESLEQQTATLEVLRIISASPGELAPVFQTILENAVQICNAKFGNLLLYDGDTYTMTALHGAPSEWDNYRRRDPTFRAGPKQPLGRLAATKQFQHVADARMETSYAERDPVFTPLVDIAGARTVLYVPMLKEDTLLGAVVIYRQEVRPFTDKQITLLQNFAAHAVIAIENARLLNETKEALEQQRASAEVLNVISNSVSDAEPVFEKIVESCERIFATSRIGLSLIGPDGLVHAGAYGKFPGAEKLRRENFPHPVQGRAHAGGATRCPISTQ